MFDTMTMTKAGGAICGALLIYLLGVWAAETVYHSGGGHGHGGEEHASPYKIDTGVQETAGEEVEIDLAALLLEADPAKGEKAFKKCTACHKVEDGANGTGPHLYALVNRAIGVVDGYEYSPALAALSAEAWTPEALNDWLENPTKFAPGTKMNIKTNKLKDRVNLIAYLQSIGG